MILDFSISNFRSIREPQTISFEATKDTHLEDYYIVRKGNYRILKMAVILGANASGKSNVVRAFEMLPLLILNPCENKTSKIEYKKFALDNEYANKDSVMAVNFLCGEQKYRYEVHFNNEMITAESLQRHPFGELRPHKVFERTTDKDTRLSSIKWGDKFRSNANTRDLNINLLHNRTVFGAFMKSNVDIPWMKEICDWVDLYIHPPVISSQQSLAEFVTYKIADNHIDRQLMTLQMQKADIGISEFKVERNAKSGVKIQLVHKGKDGGVPLDFEDQSGGTQRYYELSGILLMLVNKPQLLAIDELECRLHPDLYTHFITTFLRITNESQIVFTTHAREFLADKDLFRDDTVWFTEKNDEGATDLYSLADFGSDVLRDSTNRYNVYRAGRLGAVPRLEDTFFVKSDNERTNGKNN